MFQEYLGKSLKPVESNQSSFSLVKPANSSEPEPRTEAPVSEAPAQTVQPVAAVATPPATAQAGAVPAPSSAPAPNTQSTLALLSSGNPIDALKNLQIFQRQQQ